MSVFDPDLKIGVISANLSDLGENPLVINVLNISVSIGDMIFTLILRNLILGRSDLVLLLMFRLFIYFIVSTEKVLLHGT